MEEIREDFDSEKLYFFSLNLFVLRFNPLGESFSLSPFGCGSPEMHPSSETSMFILMSTTRLFSVLWNFSIVV